jgi:hypothetical protein
MRRSGILAGLIGLGVCSLLSNGCGSVSSPNLALSVKDQDVPVVVAIGPFDAATVRFEEESFGAQTEKAIQEHFSKALKGTGVFKEVKVLQPDSQSGKKADPEYILGLARSQNADLLLIGDVKEFEGQMSAPLPRSRFDVKMKLATQLYNVHTGRLVWRKSEMAQVTRTEWGRSGVMEEIIRNVAVPSLTAGILPSMIGHVQTAYHDNFGAPKARPAEDPYSVFGGAELVKIDADLAPPETSVAVKDHAYAIVVGVEEYRDLPKVDYAKRDAEMMKKYLTKAMGYREENVVMLLDDRVTRSQLAARFEKWLPKQVGDDPQAEVFVYYGGHGAPDAATNQSFLVPYDGDPAFLETTAYPLNKLYKTLSDLSAKRITVVLDTCFSGAGGRSVIAKGARPMLITVDSPLVASPNLVVLTASAGNQISSAFMEKRHGLFTYYFLKGIQGEADANRDGTVELQELDAYLKSHVQAVARRLNVEQTPQLLPGSDLLGARAKTPLVLLKP